MRSSHFRRIFRVSVKAGSIIIRLRAGTAELQSDLNKASGAFKDFGHHGVTGVQAVSGSLRVLEGNITNNLRAAERFLANTLNLGKAFQGIFPVVGALAFAGVLAELGKRTYDVFKELQQGPERARGAFNQLENSLQGTNAGLAVSNARLQADIDKLQGKPTNNLKVALLEAVDAAARLKKELDGDLKSLYDLIEKQRGGSLQIVVDWATGKGSLRDLQKRIGGITGQGGANADIQDAMEAGLKKIVEAKTLDASRAAQDALRNDMQKRFNDLLDAANAKKREFEKLQSGYNVPPKTVKTSSGAEASTLGYRVGGVNENENLEHINADIRTLTEIRDAAIAKVNNAELTQKRDILQADKENARAESPLRKRLEELDAQLAGLKAKLNAIGLSESAHILAAGYSEASKHIAETEEAMSRMNRKMTDADAFAIYFKDIQIANTEAQIRWTEKFTQATDQIRDRIQAQSELNKAIGGNYDQQRTASVNSRIAETVGHENFNNPDFQRTHAAEIGALRAQLGQQYDTEESGKNTNALQQLEDKIRLTNALAVAEQYGAEAVRQAELQERIRVATRGMDADAAAKLRSALVAEEGAERSRDTQKQLANLREQATAMERLANAYGQKARLQAESQNAYDKAIKGGKSPEVAQGEAQEVLRKNQDEVLTEANKLATSYSDQLDHINQMSAALRKIAAEHGSTLQIEAALKDLEDQRLKLATEQALKVDSAKAGLQAFFLEMQQQAEKTSKIIYDALNSALDKTSDNLANMLTEKKPKGGWGKMWGKEFQDVGHQLTEATIKSGLHNALGGLAKKLGIEGKPDGSPGHAFHVIVDNAGPGTSAPGATPGSTGNAVPNPLATLGGSVFSGAVGGGIFSLLGSILGAGAGASAGAGATPSVSSSITYPGLADGGDVFGGGLAMVGERGQEVVELPTGARVSPLDKIGGHTFSITNHNTIDARGAEIGVESRIEAVMEQVHHSAITQSLRGANDMKRRTPQKSNNR
jgi:hypothetical protein